ncbi:MAG: sugar phosphate isomerase/epimerase family protein [Verrucomicrobiota bacterium]
MPYRRVISTMGCPELGLAEAAALARRHGLDGIELRSLGGTMDLPAHFAATYGTPDNLAAQKPAMAVTALCPSLKLAGGTAEDRDAFLRVVPWAEALGAPWLRVFDGNAAADPAGAAATVRWWREQRSRHGWRADIMVETHDSLLTAAAVRRFLEACPGTAIRWDSHHTWKKGGEDPLVTWRDIKGAVVSIDVKDSVSRPSAKHPYTYILPGDGEFPMAPLRAALAAEYSGAVSLEWEKLWHPYLAPLDEALAAAHSRSWW